MDVYAAHLFWDCPLLYLRDSPSSQFNDFLNSTENVCISVVMLFYLLKSDLHQLSLWVLWSMMKVFPTFRLHLLKFTHQTAQFRLSQSTSLSHSFAWPIKPKPIWLASTASQWRAPGCFSNSISSFQAVFLLINITCPRWLVNHLFAYSLTHLLIKWLLSVTNVPESVLAFEHPAVETSL